MKGLGGTFADIVNNESFDTIQEFHDYIRSTGKRDFIGSVECKLCLGKFHLNLDRDDRPTPAGDHSGTMIWQAGRSPIDSAKETGIAVYHCTDCLRDLAKEYAGTEAAE